MLLSKDSFYGRGDGGSAPRSGVEEPEEMSTPTNAANLRAKMLQQQQRQRLLAKQRGPVAGSSMVLANAAMPATEVTTPQSTRSNLARSSTNMSSFSSFVDEDADGAIMPEVLQDTKEEEARRRSNLTQALSAAGIDDVFDPTPTDGGRDNRFDVRTVAPSDMRAFLHNPAPKHAGMFQCRMTRERGSGLNKLYPKYTLETDDGVFLMTAKKQPQNKTSNYSITMSKTETGKDPEVFLGKLRSDFLGVEFVAYGPGMNPAKIDKKLPPGAAFQQTRQELAAVQYTSSLSGAKKTAPRKMTAIIPRVQPNGERLVCQTLNPDTEGLIALFKSASATNMLETYRNKVPKWSDKIGAYVLNFNKRVTQASVKNFQLVNETDPDTVMLQFGRVDKEVFNLDFSYPLSPFQAFAMCLSSFDYKLCCD